MANACIFGASNVKISNLNWGSTRPKIVRFQPSLAMRTRAPIRIDGLAVSRRSASGLVVCQCSPAEVFSSSEEEDESICSDLLAEFLPCWNEASRIITKVSKRASIREVEMERDSTLHKDSAHTRMKLSIKLDGLDRTGKIDVEPSPISATLSIASEVEVTDENGSIASPSLAFSKPGNVQALRDIVADEGLVILDSPKTGYFRRSKIVKGVRGPPSCEEKQKVKKGQVMCYIEQLVGEFPVQSTISGEVVKILKEDGDAVGKGGPLIAIRPSL